MVSRGRKRTHTLKRLVHVVRGVVVYIYLFFHVTFHGRVGRVSEIKYGVIAAARAFTS